MFSTRMVRNHGRHRRANTSSTCAWRLGFHMDADLEHVSMLYRSGLGVWGFNVFSTWRSAPFLEKEKDLDRLNLNLIDKSSYDDP